MWLRMSVDAFESCLRALEATVGLEVGGGMALPRNARINQSRRNGAHGGNNYNGITDIPWNSPGDAVGRICKLRYYLAQHKPPLSPTSSESALDLKLWTGRTNPLQTPYALNGVAHGYLPRRGYQGRYAIHTYQTSLWFLLLLHWGLKYILRGHQVQSMLQLWLLFYLILGLVLSSNTLKGLTLSWEI